MTCRLARRYLRSSSSRVRVAMPTGLCESLRYKQLRLSNTLASPIVYFLPYAIVRRARKKDRSTLGPKLLKQQKAKSHQPSGRPGDSEVVTGKSPLSLPSPRASDLDLFMIDIRSPPKKKKEPL